MYLTDILYPFASVAAGVPNNWPDDCVLRFDLRPDGDYDLSYYGINEVKSGITIKQWRALLKTFNQI
jgi:hypothetical protein